MRKVDIYIRLWQLKPILDKADLTALIIITKRLMQRDPLLLVNKILYQHVLYQLEKEKKDNEFSCKVHQFVFSEEDVEEKEHKKSHYLAISYSDFIKQFVIISDQELREFLQKIEHAAQESKIDIFRHLRPIEHTTKPLFCSFITAEEYFSFDVYSYPDVRQYIKQNLPNFIAPAKIYLQEKLGAILPGIGDGQIENLLSCLRQYVGLQIQNPKKDVFIQYEECLEKYLKNLIKGKNPVCQGHAYRQLEFIGSFLSTKLHQKIDLENARFFRIFAGFAKISLPFHDPFLTLAVLYVLQPLLNNPQQKEEALQKIIKEIMRMGFPQDLLQGREEQKNYLQQAGLLQALFHFAYQWFDVSLNWGVFPLLYSANLLPNDESLRDSAIQMDWKKMQADDKDFVKFYIKNHKNFFKVIIADDLVDLTAWIFDLLESVEVIFFQILDHIPGGAGRMKIYHDFFNITDEIENIAEKISRAVQKIIYDFLRQYSKKNQSQEQKCCQAICQQFLKKLSDWETKSSGSFTEIRSIFFYLNRINLSVVVDYQRCELNNLKKMLATISSNLTREEIDIELKKKHFTTLYQEEQKSCEALIESKKIIAEPLGLWKDEFNSRLQQIQQEIAKEEKESGLLMENVQKQRQCGKAIHCLQEMIEMHSEDKQELWPSLLKKAGVRRFNLKEKEFYAGLSVTISASCILSGFLKRQETLLIIARRIIEAEYLFLPPNQLFLQNPFTLATVLYRRALNYYPTQEEKGVAHEYLLGFLGKNWREIKIKNACWNLNYQKVVICPENRANKAIKSHPFHEYFIQRLYDLLFIMPEKISLLLNKTLAKCDEVETKARAVDHYFNIIPTDYAQFDLLLEDRLGEKLKNEPRRQIEREADLLIGYVKTIGNSTRPQVLARLREEIICVFEEKILNSPVNKPENRYIYIFVKWQLLLFRVLELMDQVLPNIKEVQALDTLFLQLDNPGQCYTVLRFKTYLEQEPLCLFPRLCEILQPYKNYVLTPKAGMIKMLLQLLNSTHKLEEKRQSLSRENKYDEMKVIDDGISGLRSLPGSPLITHNTSLDSTSLFGPLLFKSRKKIFVTGSPPIIQTPNEPFQPRPVTGKLFDPLTNEGNKKNKQSTASGPSESGQLPEFV